MKTPPPRTKQTSLPPIEDNARGVDPDTLCTVWVWCVDGRRYKMQAVPRGILEASFVTIGEKLLELNTVNRLQRIVVEPCVDGKLVKHAE